MSDITKVCPVITLTSKLSLRGMDVIRECGRVDERRRAGEDPQFAIDDLRRVVSEMAQIIADFSEGSAQ